MSIWYLLEKYFVSPTPLQAAQRGQKNHTHSATLTSLAAKTMVVNWERSPHSAKKVKVKAWTKIGEIKCSHFFWGIAVPGPDSTSPGPFNSLVLWSCEGQGGQEETTTKQPTIRLEMSWKQPKWNTYNSKAKGSHLVAGMLLATNCCIAHALFIGHHLKN